MAIKKATAGIFNEIKKRLEEHGINITLVNITNIDYSDAFEKAVEEKQVALQQSQKEKNNTIRLKEVAEQQVVKAEADAKAKVLESEAEAKAILVKAEAEAKSIEMRNKALAQSRALIEYETVKTWDGKLPVQMLGSTPVPFLNILNKEPWLQFTTSARAGNQKTRNKNKKERRQAWLLRRLRLPQRSPSPRR